MFIFSKYTPTATKRSLTVLLKRFYASSGGVPPFTKETANSKVKKAQNLWNTKDPYKVVNAYTKDSIWRNRDKFFTGHDSIIKFLKDKWSKELDYRLRKELFSWTDNKIAVEFWYEYHDHQKQASILVCTLSVLRRALVKDGVDVDDVEVPI
ncbi:12797_t:CDS:2 [Funneliformis caledonium]|uniref:12797_t:CDS:1 n=1 Tax=Funneliformis caledonium TaxID=1117310 RepID=A0A9N9B4A9_9GLOM|nr:12797_t:CDS:2 [Funneliformis caledonium]